MHTYEITQVAQAEPEAYKQSEETINGILERSATDAEFRQKLISDPRSAVSEFTGREIGEFNVVFVENRADVTIVLPDAVDPAAELSEAELETVAGGSELIAATLCCAASAVALIRAICR
ncbi:MAG TPA: hypothetical protein VKA84_27750 [Gemmatimonadaceae bacterium]|nr:hypothetical protein [Gemmatimonadaceae bacterium]